jgi:hypothetical protein
MSTERVSNGQWKEWKHWQGIYNSLVTDHSDAGHKHKREIRELTVENALFYIREQADYGIYPAKSYMVAIIYATKISQTYREDFYEVLDDPELLCGQDEFFVPYSQNKAFYDELIEVLAKIPNWIEMGWAPKTVEYFHLECTEAGVASLN